MCAKVTEPLFERGVIAARMQKGSVAYNKSIGFLRKIMSVKMTLRAKPREEGPPGKVITATGAEQPDEEGGPDDDERVE